jgi:hypothetical protein
MHSYLKLIADGHKFLTNSYLQHWSFSFQGVPIPANRQVIDCRDRLENVSSNQQTGTTLHVPRQVAVEICGSAGWHAPQKLKFAPESDSPDIPQTGLMTQSPPRNSPVG